MKKWVTYSVIVLLTISVVINVSLYRDKASQGKEYVGAFASAISSTKNTLENLQTSENKETYLYHLLRNLERNDVLSMMSPFNISTTYFKFYITQVNEILTNPDLEFKFEYFSALEQDMNALYERLYENYDLKVDSGKEFEEILSSVILANQEYR